MPLGAMGSLVFKRITPTSITAGTPLVVWTPTTHAGNPARSPQLT